MQVETSQQPLRLHACLPIDGSIVHWTNSLGWDDHCRSWLSLALLAHTSPRRKVLDQSGSSLASLSLASRILLLFVDGGGAGGGRVVTVVVLSGVFFEKGGQDGSRWFGFVVQKRDGNRRSGWSCRRLQQECVSRQQGRRRRLIVQHGSVVVAFTEGDGGQSKNEKKRKQKIV